MANFRELPILRIPPYEAEPYDLAPVPRPDPYALDQADAESFPPSFGELMPPMDPRYLHYAQAPQRFDPRKLGRRPSQYELLERSSPPAAVPPQAAPPRIPIDLPRGGLLPGTDHTRRHPGFNFGPLGEQRSEELNCAFGLEWKPNIRDLDSEQRRDLTPPPPVPPSERWKPPASPDPQPRPRRMLVGEPESKDGKSPVIPHGKGQYERYPGEPGSRTDIGIGGSVDIGRYKLKPGIYGSMIVDQSGRAYLAPWTYDMRVESPEGYKGSVAINPKNKEFKLQTTIPIGRR